MNVMSRAMAGVDRERGSTTPDGMPRAHSRLNTMQQLLGNSGGRYSVTPPALHRAPNMIECIRSTHAANAQPRSPGAAFNGEWARSERRDTLVACTSLAHIARHGHLRHAGRLQEPQLLREN
jgi:hypothetical protein